MQPQPRERKTMTVRKMKKVGNKAIDEFFEKRDEEGIALTYDDVRLKTDYSDVLPRDANLDSRFSRRVPLRIPIASAAMDTVTESTMAIALAAAGGLGIIHRNLSPEEQEEEVVRVKFHLNGFIEKPICVMATETVAGVLKRRGERNFTFHSFPVLAETKLVGILTRNDFEFAKNTALPVREVMTPLQELVTATLR